MSCRWCLLFVLPACGEVVGAPYTSLGINVRFDSDLPVDQLLVSGMTSSGEAAFEPATLPESPRLLVGGRESLVILLDDSLDAALLRIRVDGLWHDEVAGSGADDVAVVSGALVGAHVRLRGPAICGDGVVAPGLEDCDDGSAYPGDGCNQRCDIEPGFACVIAPPAGPSVCAPGRTKEE